MIGGALWRRFYRFNDDKKRNQKFYLIRKDMMKYFSRGDKDFSEIPLSFLVVQLSLRSSMTRTAFP